MPSPVRLPVSAAFSIFSHMSFSICFTAAGSGSFDIFVNILFICSISRSIISSINLCAFLVTSAKCPQLNSEFSFHEFLTNEVRLTSINLQLSYGDRTISPHGLVETEPKPSFSYISEGVILFAVSQKRRPGSAEACADSIISCHSSRAFAVSQILGSFESTGQRSSTSSPPLTAFINSSVNLTEIFAPVTRFKSLLIFIKSNICGWCTDMLNIKAPLLPPCATSLHEFENLSMKTSIPSVVFAAFEVSSPFGLIDDISKPTPPLLFII